MDRAPDNLTVVDFIDSTPVDLWRGTKLACLDCSVLHPRTNAAGSDGRASAVDVKTEARGDERWVVPHKTYRDGVSLFDRAGVLAGPWRYLKIPKGCPIPRGLIIHQGAYSAVRQATHYNISPERPMPLVHFIWLLNELYANARAHASAEVVDA